MTNLEIEAFLAVCTHKSVSKAASELFISQSSLSERLKTLEGKLGCVLFLRSRGNREIILTPEGQSFYRLALQHRSIVEKMRAVGKPPQTTKLRVGCLSSIGNCFMPLVYQRFIQRNPDSQLEFYTMVGTAAVTKIANRELDLAFSTRSLPSDQVAATPFFSEPMMLICSENSDYPDVVELDMLSPKDEVYIRWSRGFEFWHQSYIGLDTPFKLTLNNLNQYWRFVEGQRNAWSIVPCSVARSAQSAGNMRQCRMAFRVPNRMIFVHAHLKDLESDGSLLFLECFRDIFREQAFEGMLL